MSTRDGEVLDTKLSHLGNKLLHCSKDFGGYFVSTAIVFLFSWLIFVINIVIFPSYFEEHRYALIFLGFFLVFVCSAITIDFIIQIKLNLVFILFLTILFFSRKFIFYDLSHGKQFYEFSRGFIVGNLFHSLIPIVLFPFFVGYLGKYLNDCKRIFYCFVAITLLFILEYTLDYLNIELKATHQSRYQYLLNFASYILAMLMFLFYKNNIKGKNNNFVHPVLRKYIKLLLFICGCVIFVLFILFA
ncbi:hypothetical protein LU293_06475 [Moraxella nasovis]|uniref:hypothetical protein n=1 Tax=Moraxella nasovis TaxID=2904121 RepID=UPI001F61D797|nr:hypothetical protein [Moraxella nasovis]UNU72754.1 hypothetical protein LU293_06475 [Moraxella nasovis]